MRATQSYWTNYNRQGEAIYITRTLTKYERDQAKISRDTKVTVAMGAAYFTFFIGILADLAAEALGVYHLYGPFALFVLSFVMYLVLQVRKGHR
jgi:hypothetical protein